MTLLARDEPPPVLECGSDRGSNFVIVVDHASALIPRALDGLGLPAAELERHIAWDIGSLGVARELGVALDAPVIAQSYSRLVIDCNRDPCVASSIVQLSEHTPVPGNIDLTPAQVALRQREIFDPYHERIRALLDARQAAGRATIFVAQHTMTDVSKGCDARYMQPSSTTATAALPGGCSRLCAASRDSWSGTTIRTS